MAITLTWGDVKDCLVNRLPRLNDDSFAPRAINMALNRAWGLWDWRESIGSLPPFWVIPDVQDYYLPFATVPTDFYGLRQCYLCQVDVDPIWTCDLKVIQDVPTTHYTAYPQAISFEKSLVIPGSTGRGGFRLHPLPPPGMAPARYFVKGTYKKRPTQVTANSYQAALIPFDDMYFDVCVVALEWAYSMIGTSDSKAQADLYQRLLTFLNDMASKEGYELGQPQIAPAEALVSDYPGIPYLGGPVY